MLRLQRVGAFGVVAAFTLTGCGEEAPTTIDPTPGGHSGRYTATAMVLESEEHGPQLCLGAVPDSLPPQCSGSDIVGWDWSAIEGEQSLIGTTWGEYTVVGSYDGESFTLAEPPVPVGRDDQRPAGSPRFDRTVTPCEPPTAGWIAAVNPATATDATLQSAIEYSESQHDFAGLWMDQSINPALTGDPMDLETNDPARLILNVRFTGLVDEHRLDLQAIWGGALCVTSGARTEAQLLAIQAEVDDLPGVLSSFVDTIGGTVGLHVVADTDGLQKRLDERYGPGAVRVTSALTPAD